MLPGKKYKPEDLLFVLKRRIWLLILPFAIVSAGTAVVVRNLPDRYKSQATILIVPQRVPESVVRSPVSSRTAERLRVMYQQITSRPRLQRVIEEFNLYPEERQIMQDAVDRMKDNDIVLNAGGGDIITITYYGDDAQTVQKVAERLAQLLIEVNRDDRSVVGDVTKQFLDTTVETARRKLADHEAKLQQYRTSHMGELPSQLDANLQGMQQTMMQIQQVNQSLAQDREQRMAAEKLLLELEVDPQLSDPGGATFIPATPDAPARVSGGTAGMQLELAKQQLAAMTTTKGEGYPDVKLMKKLVAELQLKADAEALARPVSVDAGLPPAELLRRRKIQDLKTQIEALDRATAAKQNEDKRLHGVATNLQRRIEKTPMRETEMTELTRDYATLARIYTDFLSKKEDSQVAANLERRPDRRAVQAARSGPGSGAALQPGSAAAQRDGHGRRSWHRRAARSRLLEYRDVSFKTDDEVAHHLALPVLAVVPLMQSDQERRSASKRRLLLGVGLGSTVAGCLAVLVYTFVR